MFASYPHTVILFLLFCTYSNELVGSVSQSFVRSRSAGRSVSRGSGDVFIQPRLAVRHRNSHIRRQSPALEAPPPLDELDMLDNSGQLSNPSNGVHAVPSSNDAVPNSVVSPQDFHEQCQSDCRLHVTNLRQAQARFEDLTDNGHSASIVHFKIKFVDYILPVMETYPYMSNSYGATEWVWASAGQGRRLLGLPTDADVLSLYILSPHWALIELDVKTDPSRCFVLHSAECRLHEIRKLLIHNVTSRQRHQRRHRDYVCHYVINNTVDGESSRLMHRCCETDEFRAGDVACGTFVGEGEDMCVVTVVIYLISAVATLYSPIVLMKIKMALKFDSVTKFFRASLKNGITGQRNYVIRISSRQLIDLSEKRPFSLPRSLFRLLFHCYGEGRCCIHWWAEWAEQPTACQRTSCYRQCWFMACKIGAVIIIYPVIMHAAVALYSPRLSLYHSLVNHTQEMDRYKSISLSVNLIATSLIPSNDIGLSLWTLFSFGAFIYTVAILSWPNNPLERCLLRYEGKRPRDQPAVLHNSLITSYKAVLQRLAYGEYRTKRHFFRVAWIPWGTKRLAYATVRAFSQIPVLNICFATFLYDIQLFGKGATQNREEGLDDVLDRDETENSPCITTCSPRRVCNRLVAFILWIGFTLLLAGYCTSVFLMIEFLMSVVFFVCLGVLLHATAVLPWLGIVLVVTFYANDTLATINAEHCYILKLIDENSPRISAVEENEEMFRDGTIQILKAHNLGAVKFIDGDSTEYVSKELYYNVCADLKQGWGAVVRRLLRKLGVVLLSVLFLFTALHALCTLTGGSQLIVTLVALLICAVPKLLDVYRRSLGEYRGDARDKRAVWAKVIPDILDRHIRVDRTRCVDPAEEELTTYDVRPIGLMDMDVPNMSTLASMQLWKFPWIVSGDQQTQSNEGFVIALANKLAAASFLTRVITRGYSADLLDDTILRQWSLLVETCILEASSMAASVAAAPLDLASLFPREYHSLVCPFDAGNTIDTAVDEINRQLYGPFTRGVLVTLGNTSCALLKVSDSRLMAFNSSCHGDQVTDVFGAVLIATDFNTQNLQTTLKFLIDPNRPDSVPVYSVVPVEAFSFSSPEIFDMESSI